MPKFKIRLSFAIITVTMTIFTATALNVFYKHFSKVLPKEKEIALTSYMPDELINEIGKRMIYLSQHVRGVKFQIYKVKMKENLWTISRRYNYSVHTIIGCNPQLKTYNVDYRQKILLPSYPGCLHIIQKEDDLLSVCKRYDVKAEDIEKFNPYFSGLKPGEMVFIPDRRPDIRLMNADMKQKYELRSLFVSPVGGRLTSTFGRRRDPVTQQAHSFHGGIDIAVKEGTPIGAAADGVVICASYDVGHYGTAVFIDHQNGYVTHYGHLSKILVRCGQKVKAHQLIARSGSTGRVTGPHLHFTIKKNDQPIDPLKFLW
jgi:hypothetical protein